MDIWYRIRRAVAAALAAFRKPPAPQPTLTFKVRATPAAPSAFTRTAARPEPPVPSAPPRAPKPAAGLWQVARADQYYIYAAPHNQLKPQPDSALAYLAKRADSSLKELWREHMAYTLPLPMQLHWWWILNTTDGTFETNRPNQRCRYLHEWFGYEVHWFKKEPVTVVIHRGGEKRSPQGETRLIFVTRMALPSPPFTLQDTLILTPELTSEARRVTQVMGDQ